LADRAVGGRLAELLGRYRDEDASFEAIAYKLREEHGIVTTSATVRRWCIDLGLFTPTARASA
jgi:hypothetical protein